MKLGVASLCCLAWLLTLGSADYIHRHEHNIQMKNYEHPWFGNNSIRFCAFNQYLDEHEGRCMIIPGGGTAISIDDGTTCEVEALRPHPSLPNSYYACRKTKTILAECKSGQRFENRLKRCAIDVNSSEDEFSGDKGSPEAYDHIHLPACEKPGRFPVPQGNCTIFYACTSNGFRLFRTIYRCPSSTGFDPFTKMCSPEFACDGEPDAQITKIHPETELTTIYSGETTPLDSSTPSSVSEKSTTPNFRSSDNSGYDSTTEIVKTSTISGFNEAETTSFAPPIDLITENEFLTTTDNIVGANQLLTISTTHDYENQETTPTYEDTSTRKDVQTSEDPFVDESSTVEETSTLNSVRNGQESTTISPEISTVAETTLANESDEDEETTIGYFTTIEPETEETTPWYLSEKTSQPDKIATTEKWLFDFYPTEVSTTMESSDPPKFTETLFTTPSTTAEFIPFTESSVVGATNNPEVVSETTSLLEESTTEIPATSVSSFIIDRQTGDAIEPTTEAIFVAQTEEAPDLGETLQNNLLTTSGDWETTTPNILDGEIENVATSTTVVNDYANADFLENESTTENSWSSFSDSGSGDGIETIETTISPQNEPNTAEFNHEINDETTISSEDGLEISGFDEETSPEYNSTTSRPDEGASDLPQDDFGTTSTDIMPEVQPTSSYTLTPSAESTTSTTEATELISDDYTTVLPYTLKP